VTALQFDEDSVNSGVALKSFDLGLDVGGIDGGLALVQRVGCLNVEEVLVEADDLDRVADLIDRAWGA
jgi:hypothetical protein